MPETGPTGAFPAVVIAVAALNLAYGLVEIGVAMRIGSVSLLADSIDVFEDGAVNILIALALGWSATSGFGDGNALDQRLAPPDRGPWHIPPSPRRRAGNPVSGAQ